MSVQLHIRSVTKRASMSILISVLITFLVVALILWLAAALAFLAEWNDPGKGMATLGWAMGRTRRAA